MGYAGACKHALILAWLDQWAETLYALDWRTILLQSHVVIAVYQDHLRLYGICWLWHLLCLSWHYSPTALSQSTDSPGRFLLCIHAVQLFGESEHWTASVHVRGTTCQGAAAHLLCVGAKHSRYSAATLRQDVQATTMHCTGC